MCRHGKRNPFPVGDNLGQAALSLGQQELPEEPRGQDLVLSWGAGLAQGAEGFLVLGHPECSSQRDTVTDPRFLHFILQGLPRWSFSAGLGWKVPQRGKHQ